MSQETIRQANDIINAKTGYVGGGMEGYAALSLIDEEGYPTTSTLTIVKADGIKWLTFATSPDDNKAKRIEKCSRASVCINSSEYNITLVGTIEIVTDMEIKKDMWLEPMNGSEHWTGYDDPNFCVLRFTTERYNLYVGYEEARGNLTSDKSDILKAKKSTPSFEPILIYNNGQCAKAMELYQKAFGAEVTAVTLYSEADPKDVGPVNESDKNLIMNAQMRIGRQTILLCDDNKNNTKIGNHLQMVLEFDTEEGVKSAYNALADGATDLLPPHSASYSPCVAGLTDVYGIPWQLMVWHGY